MSAQILTLLKFGLLALLYLFFVRVLFSVWAELKPTGKLAQETNKPAPAAPRQPTSRSESPSKPGVAQRSTVVASAPAPAPPSTPAAPPAATGDSQSFSPLRHDPFMPAQGYLLVTEPENMAGLTYDLGTELTVGRAPGCSISLDDTFVSSLHARIFRHEGAYVLEDLGSTNGTFLNGTKVTEPTIMKVSDNVRFGSMNLELR